VCVLAWRLLRRDYIVDQPVCSDVIVQEHSRAFNYLACWKHHSVERSSGFKKKTRKNIAMMVTVTMEQYHDLANEGDLALYSTYQRNVISYSISSRCLTLYLLFLSPTSLNHHGPQPFLPTMKSGSVTLLTSI
jgi:hypothetical protein